jgi:hypothetical protein
MGRMIMSAIRTYDRIGYGMTLPFRRLGAGITTGYGVDVVSTQVQIVLGTLSSFPGSMGELPFNQKLGTRLQHLRHKGSTDLTTREIAVLYVVEKLRDHVPNIRVRAVRFTPIPDKKMIDLQVEYEILDRKGGNVIAKGLQESVQI